MYKKTVCTRCMSLESLLAYQYHIFTSKSKFDFGSTIACRRNVIFVLIKPVTFSFALKEPDKSVSMKAREIQSNLWRQQCLYNGLVLACIQIQTADKKSLSYACETLGLYKATQDACWCNFQKETLVPLIFLL